MNIIITGNNPIPRLTTLTLAATCITLGLATPTRGQVTPRETASRVNRTAAVASENLPLTSPESASNCNLNCSLNCSLNNTDNGRSPQNQLQELKNQPIAPRTTAEVGFRPQLNCVFSSPFKFSEATLLAGLQVDYQSDSSQLFPGATGEPNLAEMLAQSSYYDDDRPTITAIPRAGVGGRKGVYGGLSLQVSNLGSNNGILDLSVEGGEKTVGASLSYTDPWFSDSEYDFGYRIGVFSSRNPENNFLNGSREVNLNHDHTPWVDRLGGGVEFFQPVTEDGLILAIGANYQRVAIRDAGFSDRVFSRDELGNRVTVGNDGMDPLFLLGVGLFQDRRNDPNWPTSGYRFRLGSEQSIPLGDSQITMNRIMGSYSHFVPMGENTIAFSVQAGTIIGDAPPYQAFEIGGGNSVRGYGGGELGSGRSFVNTAVEYRFSIADELELPFISRVGGTLFFDYGTDLGSGDTVIGEPAEVRQKPGNGFGGGVGVRLLTTFGQVRAEVGMNDDGDISAHLELGDRF